jgi:Zn finger protein HypA/HybF involved in hydrogenase expression
MKKKTRKNRLKINVYVCKHCSKKYDSMAGVVTFCPHCGEAQSNLLTFEDVYGKEKDNYDYKNKTKKGTKN